MLMVIHLNITFLILLDRYERGACSIMFEFEKKIRPRYSLGQCIETVAAYFFNSNEEIVAITEKGKYTTDFPKYVSEFKEKLRWTFYTSDMLNLRNIAYCYEKNYILEVQDSKDLLRIFHTMRQSNCWNPNQHIYIYSSNSCSIPLHEEFRKMVNLVTQQYLANVVIILPLEKSFSSFQIYYWDSKIHEACVVKPELPKFFTCRFGNISPSVIYYKKNESSHSCLLKIKVVIWPPFVITKNHTSNVPVDKPIDKNSVSGFEIELMNVISKSIGFETEYYASMKEDWGRSFFNGTTTKTMLDLMMKKVDIAIGSFTTSLSRTILFKSSFSYSEEYVVCCVPSNSYLDIWSTLMSTSTLQLYISISIIYLFLTSMIWKISRNLDEKHVRYKKASTCYLYCFAILVGVSVKILPETRNGRMFLILLLTFEFFYVAFYESLLTSTLMSPKLNENIKTFEDIVDRNMEIYNQPENRRYFEHINTAFGEKAMRLWIDCINATDCLEDVHINRSKAICLGKTFKDYVTYNKLWEGKHSLSCIHHNLMTYPVVMIMRRTLPFGRQINKIIGSCLSAGLIDKWLLSSFYNRYSGSFTRRTNSSGNLKFENLKPVFLLVVTGYLVALALAAGELVYYNFNTFIGRRMHQVRIKIGATLVDERKLN